MQKKELRKNSYSVVVRDKLTGETYLTVCCNYLRRGNLIRFFDKHNKNIDLLIVDSWDNRYFAWDDFIKKIDVKTVTE